MVEDQTSLEFPSRGFTTLPLGPPEELICCTAAGPGGHPLRVLFDTGTDPSAVDAGLARRLALRTGGSGVGQGAASDMVPPSTLNSCGNSSRLVRRRKRPTGESKWYCARVMISPWPLVMRPVGTV